MHVHGQYAIVSKDLKYLLLSIRVIYAGHREMFSQLNDFHRVHVYCLEAAERTYCIFLMDVFVRAYASQR